MANDEDSEDRLTKSEFAELIQHLSAQEILTIEYRIGTAWNKLFMRQNAQAHTFVCNLCVLETSSFKNLLAHIDGKKHKLQMEKVNQLYQKKYTYPKNHKKENSVVEIKLENIEEEETVPPEEAKANGAQNTRNSCVQSAEIEKHSEIEEGGDICEDKSKEDNAKPQEISEKIEDEAVKVNPVLNETRKTSEKRALVESSSDKNICVKKPKIVINPAAALLARKKSVKAKELQESNKPPVYQTDKIIIPTAHKNKSSDKASPPNVAPKFATKSYSSKPSDNDIHGILGVEYVIKILKNRNDASPRYECGLCELVLDGYAMQRHLEGYNHRLKFCEKHFPTAIRQYRHYMQNVPEPEIFKVMTPVLVKLAQAIEQHHGRSLPYECYERDFSLNRHEILAKVFSCRHASEQYGPAFTHVVGSNEIDEWINNRHSYLPPPFSRIAIFDSKADSLNTKSNHRHLNSKNSDRGEPSFRERRRHDGRGRENAILDGGSATSFMPSGLQNDLFHPLKSYLPAEDRNDVKPVDDETYNLMVDDFLKGTLKGGSRRNSIRNTRKRSPSPVKNSSSGKRNSLSPLRQDDIWQAYRHLVDQELYKLEEQFKQYRKDPESHPSYNEEWQKFWKRRKDELMLTGLDHRNYNYQPEWVRFVKVRIEELYAQEFENLKVKSRERLCLPMSNEMLRDTKYHVKPQQANLSNEVPATNYNTQQNAGISSCSMTSQTEPSNAPQVVPVLRLMTALEDSLGSLGPKIIDLLSKALQTEKVNPLHVNNIILNDDNCSLIETAKEKLKGLVITGLFEGSKKKVLKEVVTEAEALLHYAYQFKKQLSSQLYTSETSTNQSQSSSQNCFSRDNVSLNVSNAHKPQSGPINLFNKTGNSLPSIDKKELASKLATSLVAQGKTDFDPSQLQQIIAVYKLIEKKKRETGAVQTNKSYLQDSASVSKKTLSDTLADLLKPSSSFSHVTSHARNVSATSNSATATSSVAPGTFGKSAPSNSFTSALQNPRDNFFNNTARSMPNAYGANNGGRNPIEQQSVYPRNFNSNMQPNQPNFNASNMYSNQLQNDSRMAQNWGWNANMNSNQNYNMNPTNQNSNWQHF